MLVFRAAGWLLTRWPARDQEGQAVKRGVPPAGDGEDVIGRALAVHRDSAARHAAAAALWEARGESEKAEFEHRCAVIEHEAAEIETRRRA